MTQVELYKDTNGNILGWQIKGHTGYAESGKDIICSAISTITQATIIQMDLLKLKFNKIINNGYMKVMLDKNYEPLLIEQFPLITMQIVLKEIAKQYPKYVCVKEALINESK